MGRIGCPHPKKLNCQYNSYWNATHCFCFPICTHITLLYAIIYCYTVQAHAIVYAACDIQVPLNHEIIIKTKQKLHLSSAIR